MNNKQIIEKVLKDEDIYFESPCEEDVKELIKKALSLKDAEVKKAIDETFKEFKPKSIFIINFCNELLTKLGLSEMADRKSAIPKQEVSEEEGK